MTVAMNCGFCGVAANGGSASLGEMLGPLGQTHSGDPIYVHRQCALWSPEVTRMVCMPSAGLLSIRDAAADL
jgi:hypothetical protein